MQRRPGDGLGIGHGGGEIALIDRHYDQFGCTAGGDDPQQFERVLRADSERADVNDTLPLAGKAAGGQVVQRHRRAGHQHVALALGECDAQPARLFVERDAAGKVRRRQIGPG